jgi:hypothetical protein
VRILYWAILLLGAALVTVFWLLYRWLRRRGRALLRGFAEPLLLLEPLFTLLQEARPRARDPFDAGTVRSQFFEV